MKTKFTKTQIFSFVLGLCFCLNMTSIAYATTYTSVKSGEWSATSTWVGGILPPEPIPAGDIVNVNHWVSTFSTASITNNGTVNVTDQPSPPVLDLNGSTTFINNGDFNGFSQTFGAALYVRSGSSFTNNGNFHIEHPATNSTPVRLTGGDFTNSSTGTLDLVKCLFTIENENSLFTNEAGGTVNIGASTQFNIFSFTSTNVVFSNSGTVEVDGQMFFQEGNYENLSTGIINLNGNTFGQLYLSSILNNEGTINMNSAVNTWRTIDLQSSSAAINSTTGSINVNSGFLRGNGSMTIPTLTNEAILIPFDLDGSGDAVFDLTGDYDGDGEFRIIIYDPAIRPTGQLAATGTADISQQTLQAFMFGYNPPVGTTFTIITAAGGVTGTFQSTTLPFLSGGKVWKVNYGADYVELEVALPSSDSDGDGVDDDDDLCSNTPTGEGVNADGCSCSQVTVDDGDPCTLDECTDGVVTNTYQDADGDNVCDAEDNCPDTPSGEGVNTEGCSCSQVTVDDGDPCTLDECTDGVVTNTYLDADNDGVCDANDVCPGGDDNIDTDIDGIPDYCDDCPNDADNDIDEDDVCGDVDNCPTDANAGQEDNDNDGAGDACDDDDDNDGILDDCDTAPFVDNFVFNGIGPDFPQQWLCGNNNNKVKVCHVPAGNPANAHTICVSENAVSKHVGKHEEDYLGECTCTSQNLVSSGNSSFEARPFGQKVNLYWVVPDNQAIDHFKLEHSTDGEAFELMTEKSTEIGVNWELYELTDEWPADGDNYYRVTIFRKNGEIEVLPIRKIYFNKPPAYGLVPNPASTETFFNIELKRGLSVTISIFNSIGQQVYQKDIGKVEKAFERIDLTDFEDGLYIVSLKVGYNVYSSKLVVRN